MVRREQEREEGRRRGHRRDHARDRRQTTTRRSRARSTRCARSARRRHRRRRTRRQALYTDHVQAAARRRRTNVSQLAADAAHLTGGDTRSFFLQTGDDGTKFSATVTASATSLNFQAKLGPFGLFVKERLRGDRRELRRSSSSTPGGDDRLDLFAFGGQRRHDRPRPHRRVHRLVAARRPASSHAITFTGAAPGCAAGEARLREPAALHRHGQLPGAARLPRRQRPGRRTTRHRPTHLQPREHSSANPRAMSSPSASPAELGLLELPDAEHLLAPRRIPARSSTASTRRSARSRISSAARSSAQKLPLIGDALAEQPGRVKVIDDFRTNFLKPLANTIRENNLNIDGLAYLIRVAAVHRVRPGALQR